MVFGIIKWALIIIGIVTVLGFLGYNLFIIKESPEQHDLTVLENIIPELRENPQPDACDNLATRQGRQICYSLYLTSTMTHNLSVNSKICDKVLPQDKDICVNYS